MIWAEYKRRATALARAFEELGRPDLSHYWWACCRLDRDWPEAHWQEEIDIPLIVRELEEDEERAVELLADRFQADSASRYAAARTVLARMG